VPAMTRAPQVYLRIGDRTLISRRVIGHHHTVDERCRSEPDLVST
jgi:hypothetical protein